MKQVLSIGSDFSQQLKLTPTDNHAELLRYVYESQSEGLNDIFKRIETTISGNNLSKCTEKKIDNCDPVLGYEK